MHAINLITLVKRVEVMFVQSYGTVQSCKYIYTMTNPNNFALNELSLCDIFNWPPHK